MHREVKFKGQAYTFTGYNTNTVFVDYSITNGTVVPSTANGMTGETISLKITPDTNYYLESASYSYGTTTTQINGNSFTMPDAEVTVTAVFKTKTVTFNCNGGTVALPTTNPTRSGYSFSGWNTSPDGSGTAFTASTPVNGDITVYAVWTANPVNYSPTYYTISASAGKGGSISPSGSSSIAFGGNMDYTITADKGYKIQDVLVDGASVGAVSVYSFMSVGASHTISAIFKKTEILNPFADIDKGDWFYDSIMFAYENELMTGTGSDTFSPNGDMTRAMIVTVLLRLSGNAVGNVNSFSDVPSGSWYENAAAWAAANAITSGIGGNQFAPDNSLTREQLAVMLYNYAKYKGLDVSIGEDTNILSYGDALAITDYAYSALQWACGAGIIKGDGGNLNPQCPATRAEVAAMMQRFIENLIK